MSSITYSPETSALSERDNFITNLAETIGSRAKAATVFGEPIVRENTTVVPVARARWGVGGGGGGAQGATEPSGSPRGFGRGFGGGGGMVVNPVGYLVIRDRIVEYHETRRTGRILASIVLGIFLGAFLRRRKRT